MTPFLFSLAAAEGAREFHIHQPWALPWLKGTLFGEDQLLEINNMIITQWIIVAVLVILGFVINRTVLSGRPSRLRSALELLMDFLEGWFASFIGSRQYARQYMPLLCTLFLFILFSNYSGLLPTAGYTIFAPTGRWGTTLGLGIVVAIAVQVIAIRSLGVGGWLKHILHLGPLSLLEEFVRPFSLSLRLFGNIFGEETLLAVIIFLAPMFAPIPIMVLSLVFGALQAVVFTTLTAIYIGGVLEAHHAHGPHPEGEAEHQPVPAH